MWTEATGGRVRFVRNADAPRTDVLVVGVGDLAAVGYVSGRAGILALGGGVTDAQGFVTNAVVWLDVAENWEDVYGDGDVRGTYDGFTLFLHELGHALGLPHTDGLASGDLMNSVYGGEKTAITPVAAALARQIYGQGGFGLELGDPPAGARRVTVSSGQVTDSLDFGAHREEVAPPASPGDLAIAPDTGASPSDGLTNADAITLSGTLDRAGLTVLLFDETTGLDLGAATVAGATFTKVLSLAEGHHRLRATTVDSSGATSTPSFLDVTVDRTAPTATVAGVAAGPRKTAVDEATLAFSEAIDPASLDASDLTLTRDGVVVPIAGSVTFERVSDSVFRVRGLAGSTGAAGSYSLSIAAAGVRDPAGNPGVGAAAASWLMDAQAPTSKVVPLARRQPSLSFDVGATGSDPDLAPGVAGAGIVSHDLFVSVDGAPFVFWTTVPAANPTATFQGRSDHSYAFYSVARDAAGNVETKAAVIEASTYVPDLTPPESQVATVDANSPTFAIIVTGSDQGGSGLAGFELFVQVDDGPVESVGRLHAGTADGSGVQSATFSYAARVDGLPHDYRFHSVGADGGGNVEQSPSDPDVALASVVFTPPPALSVDAIDVQKGMSQRSYVRHLDLLFNRADGLVDLLASLDDDDAGNDRIRLVRYELDGSGSGQVVPINGRLQVVGRTVAFDFGAEGIGGDRNSSVGDGYYEVQLDLDGDGSHETQKHFHRLLGNVNAQVDRIVDNLDLATITAAFGHTGDGLEEDVNGDGVVNALDRALATRARNRYIDGGLKLDD